MTLILSGTDGVSDIDGTAATPAIRGTDPNTGIFFPAADTIGFAEGGAEAMRIDSSGNVGIGTSSPLNRVHIKGTSASTYYYRADVGTTAAGFMGGESNLFILGYNTNPSLNNVLDSSLGTGRLDFGNSSGGYIAFLTGATNTTPTERMRIDSSGNVGIGTSSPSSFDAQADNLVVGTGSGHNGITVYAGTAFWSSLYFADGTSGSDKYRGIVSYDHSADAMLFYTASAERARITSGGYFKASNNGTYISSTGAYHEFNQSASGTECLAAESTNASFTSNILSLAAARNTTNNSFYAFGYYNRGAVAYKFLMADSGNCTNTNGSYGTISDAKLKQDIVDAGSQWDDIKNLRFRKYRLKSEVELNPNAKPFLGLVAQEAELVSPGLIEEHRDTEEVETTDADGNVTKEHRDLGTTTKSIKTSILYMKAVKALQEAMTRIEALEAEVAAMKAKA